MPFRRSAACRALALLATATALAVFAHPGLASAASGDIVTIAGDGAGGFNGTYSGGGGPATSASLALPSDVSSDSAGNVYIADLYSHRVRKVEGAATPAPVVPEGPLALAAVLSAGAGWLWLRRRATRIA
jgi:hypothetical protein